MNNFIKQQHNHRSQSSYRVGNSTWGQTTPIIFDCTRTASLIVGSSPPLGDSIMTKKRTTAKLEIQYVNINDIVPWEKNPKLHNDDAIDKSIDRFGVRQPVTIQKSTKRIIVGHGRYNAYKRRGLKKIPVIIYDCTNEEADAYAVADNQTTILGGWDDAMLTDVLKSIEESGMLEFTGFDDIPEIQIPDGIPIEPVLPGECMIEIYCPNKFLDKIIKTIKKWEKEPDVTINISR